MISCGRCDDELQWKQLREAYTAAVAHNHTPAEVESFLACLAQARPSGAVSVQKLAGCPARTPATPGPVYGPLAWPGKPESIAGSPGG